MTIKRTKKVQKTSYAERVLSALSHAQRDHHKKYIHMATLRTHIKKSAEAKKDPLGPSWTNWVNKAVHKLEEEGIIGSNTSDQTIFLTPRGRDSISAAKATVKIISDPESRAFRHVVASTVSSKGHKRPLSSASAGEGGEPASTSISASLPGPGEHVPEPNSTSASPARPARGATRRGRGTKPGPRNARGRGRNATQFSNISIDTAGGGTEEEVNELAWQGEQQQGQIPGRAAKRPRRSAVAAQATGTSGFNANTTEAPQRRGRPSLTLQVTPPNRNQSTSLSDRDISPLTDVSELDAEEPARLRATISAQEKEISVLRGRLSLFHQQESHEDGFGTNSPTNARNAIAASSRHASFSENEDDHDGDNSFENMSAGPCTDMRRRSTHVPGASFPRTGNTVAHRNPRSNRTSDNDDEDDDGDGGHTSRLDSVESGSHNTTRNETMDRAVPSHPSRNHRTTTGNSFATGIRHLSRTQSGTLIPHLSKQPTPAPSEESEDPGDVGDNANDTFTNYDNYDSNGPLRRGSDPASTFVPGREDSTKDGGDAGGHTRNRTLPSPELSPSELEEDGGNQSNPQGPSRTQTQLGTRTYPGRTRASQSTGHSHQSPIRYSTSESHPSDFLTPQLLEKDKQISDLLTLLASERAKLQTANSEISSHVSEASGTRASLQRVESDNVNLQRELGVLREKNGLLERRLSESETVARETGLRLLECQRVLSELQNGHGSCGGTIESLQDELEEMKVRLRAAEDRSSDLQAQFFEQRDTAATVQSELNESLLQLETLRKEKQGLDSQLATATAELGHEIAQRQTLESHITQAQQHTSQLQNKVTTLESELRNSEGKMTLSEDTNKNLVGELGSAKEKIASMERSLVAEATQHKAERQQLREKIRDLEGAVGEVRAELEGSRRRLTEVEFEKEELRLQIVGVGADLLAARMEIDSERKRANALETDLANALGRAHQLQEEFGQVKAAKDVDASTILGLKGSIEELRRRFMGELDQLSTQCHPHGLNSPIDKDSQVITSEPL